MCKAGLRARQFCRMAFPNQEVQWHINAAALAYRCGGSSGFVLCERTAFPFHCGRVAAHSTSHEVLSLGESGAHYKHIRSDIVGIMIQG